MSCPRSSPRADARLADFAIRVYQRWISPHKGFACAHRVLHRGDSCSEFARRHILERGLWSAVSGIRNQFHECGEAARYLRQRRREAMLAAAVQSEHAGVLTMAKGRSSKRSIDDRIYEEGERKRKRLNELQGDNPWWVGPEWWDTCSVGSHCGLGGCLGATLDSLTWMSMND